MTVPTHDQMRQVVVDGDVEGARALARALVDSGDDLLSAIDAGFAAGIREVGRLWEEGEYFLPELVQGAEAMKAAMAVIHPALEARRGPQRPKGRIVIGTVRGDLHDIGKTLVATLFSANGFEVHDLGADVAIEEFIARARETEADIIAASALLTTTMQGQRSLAQAVAAAGFERRVHVMVGGAPATPKWAVEIGAAFADNALAAVTVAEQLVA